MLASTNLVDCLAGHLHDVKAVVNNLLFCQGNVRFGRRYESGTHVHRDCLNSLDLIFGKLRKALVSAVDGVPVGDCLNRAFIDVIDHGDVALTLAKSLLVDSDAWHHFLRLSRSSPCHGFLQDVPCLLPTGS